jgi:hypothetical protein
MFLPSLLGENIVAYIHILFKLLLNYSLGIPRNRDFSLELIVKVYNINQGNNEARIRRCEKLNGYNAFVAKARECEAEIAGGRKPQKLNNGEKEETMRRAVHWCIAHNILNPFLETHGSAVINIAYDRMETGRRSGS